VTIRTGRAPFPFVVQLRRNPAASRRPYDCGVRFQLFSAGAFRGDPQSPEATKDCAEDWEDYADGSREGVRSQESGASSQESGRGVVVPPRAPRGRPAQAGQAGRSQNAEGKLLRQGPLTPSPSHRLSPPATPPAPAPAPPRPETPRRIAPRRIPCRTANIPAAPSQRSC